MNLPQYKPNIVLFLADDTALGAMQTYDGCVPTPHLNRLAAKGIRFDAATCSSSVCTPSRFSFLTGLFAGHCTHPHFRSQTVQGEPYAVQWNTYLDSSIQSAGNLFQERGYRTGFAGKWHVGDGSPPATRHISFDEDDRVGIAETDCKLSELQCLLQEEVRRDGGFDFAGGVIWGNNEKQPLPELRGHHVEWSTAAALEFISQPDPRPFFLHVASTTVHGPQLEECLAFDDALTPGGHLPNQKDVLPNRASLADRLKAAGVEATHDSMSILWLDDQVGALLDELERMQLADQTIFIFAADHGPEPGKASCYEIGVRIPLIISGLPGIEPGGCSQLPVQNIDVLPTLLEIVDGVPCKGLDGQSFLSCLQDENSWSRLPYFEIGHLRGIHKGPWKYIAWRMPSSLCRQIERGEAKRINPLGLPSQEQPAITMENYPAYFAPDQLYNLEEDPNEQRNLAGDPTHGAVLAEMQDLLVTRLERFDCPFDLEETAIFATPAFQEAIDQMRAEGSGFVTWWPRRFPQAWQYIPDFPRSVLASDKQSSISPPSTNPTVIF